MKHVDEIPSAVTQAEHAAGMLEYGTKRELLAKNLGARGKIRFDKQGKLHSDILEVYWEYGFYIFEGLIGSSELAELRADVSNMIEGAPSGSNSKFDARGRPALGQGFARNPYTFVKPLSDPWGGTEKLGGRHPTQMTQPIPRESAPSEVLHVMYGMCQAMPSGLRLYGHPELLAIAEAINGVDFVPFNDAIFVKQPGLGGSVAWHQDGVTHWDSEDWNEGIHGFNFQVQPYPSTLGNCLWVLPSTHKCGRIDIEKLVEENGGNEKLPGAVPLLCDAGDVTIVNRQMVHGSFANTSADLRVSLTFGFHRRSSVLGAKGALKMEGAGKYDERRIFDRSAVIAVAIDARRKYYPLEKPYLYQPFAGLEDEFRMTEETFDRVIFDYNTKDLAI